jgi:hypothetical protein
MRRSWIVLLVGLGTTCGPTGGSDADDGLDSPEATDHGADSTGDVASEDAEAPDDAGADAPDDAGSDVVWWTPTSHCEANDPDPPAWVAPPCGPGCRQVAFAADYRAMGDYGFSDAYVVYFGRQHTWVVDRATGEESVLFCHPYFVGSYELAIDGSLAVYGIGGTARESDGTASFTAIWAADLDTGRQWPLVERAGSYDEAWWSIAGLALSGRRAVFTMIETRIIDLEAGTRLSRLTVNVVDVETGEVTLVEDLGPPSGHGWPDISGDWVVFTTIADVYAHNVATGITIGPDLPGDQWFPRIDGTRIVWMDHRNSPGGYGRGGTWEFYAYDLVAEVETLLPAGESLNDYAEPDLRGDVVIWSDYRDSTPEDRTSNLFSYQFSTGREQRVTDLPGKTIGARLGDGEVLFLWTPQPGTWPVEWALCVQDLPEP